MHIAHCSRNNNATFIPFFFLRLFGWLNWLLEFRSSRFHFHFVHFDDINCNRLTSQSCIELFRYLRQRNVSANWVNDILSTKCHKRIEIRRIRISKCQDPHWGISLHGSRLQCHFRFAYSMPCNMIGTFPLTPLWNHFDRGDGQFPVSLGWKNRNNRNPFDWRR